MGLVLLNSIFSCFLYTNFEEISKQKEEISKQKIELETKLEETEYLLKHKDDKIIELEFQLDKYIALEIIDTMGLPNIDRSKKTYMDYCCLSKNSKQGSIVYDTNAWTDETGLRRWNEYYCVALGSYYGKVGDKFYIETDTGNKYKVIKADEKSDLHTDIFHQYTVNSRCMMECVVETAKLSSTVKSTGNANNIAKISGAIIKISKIGGE